jgi:predicted RNA-binding protein with PIN domain
VANTPDSVFCRRGAGVNVRWDEVPKYMHLESVLKPDKEAQALERRQGWNLDEKALEQIMEREFGPIRRRMYSAARTVYAAEDTAEEEQRKHHLIIDGYNVLFAWEETKAASERSLDLARTKLMDILADYSGFTGDDVLLVFDAYRSPDNTGKRFEHHGIEVVFTEAGESADAFIERMANRIGRDDRVTVVSSDNLVRLGSFRSGVQRMSSRNLEEAVSRINGRIAEIIRKQNLDSGARLGEILDREELEEWLSRTQTSSEEPKT